METACVLVKLSLSLKILQQLFHRLAFYFENMPVFGTPSLNPAKQKKINIIFKLMQGVARRIFICVPQGCLKNIIY